MLCDIEEEALKNAVAELKRTNADVDGVKADVSLKAELQAAADATLARYGKVHILVNNAGVGGGGGYGEWTDGSWNWVLGVNLMSVIWGVEIFGPLIETHGEGGQIVSTASIAGLISGANPTYAVSKYGVVALSEGLRTVLAPKNIGVSVLCPGIIRTQIMESRRNLPERYAGKVKYTATGRTARRVREGVPRADQQRHRSALCRRAGARGDRKRLALHFHRLRVRAGDRQPLRRHQAGLRAHPRPHAAAVTRRLPGAVHSIGMNSECRSAPLTA
jgi:NAD(P)-dependent dehydrogenase (short-subunit alcohol dehydrogenase family)